MEDLPIRRIILLQLDKINLISNRIYEESLVKDFNVQKYIDKSEDKYRNNQLLDAYIISLKNSIKELEKEINILKKILDEFLGNRF